MVYVVERYLPGLHRSDLLRGLLRLEQGSEETERGAEVRYLGSTIVLRDEACFCRFEGPSSDAVAEVNRRAGLPFARIVPEVTVHPKGAEMSTYPSIPATVEIKRGRLFGLVIGVAALTAAVTWAISAYAFQSGGSSRTTAAAPALQGYMSYLGSTATSPTVQANPSAPRVDPLAVGYLQGQGYTPAQIRAWTVGACSQASKPAACFGPSRGANLVDRSTKVDPLAVSYLTGRGLSPSEVRSWTVGACSHAVKAASCFAAFDRNASAARSGPTTESILASMTPETRQYTKRIMSLTAAQLAAGAAGHP